jgi:hypothetical protein
MIVNGKQEFRRVLGGRAGEECLSSRPILPSALLRMAHSWFPVLILSISARAFPYPSAREKCGGRLVQGAAVSLLSSGESGCTYSARHVTGILGSFDWHSR